MWLKKGRRKKKKENINLIIKKIGDQKKAKIRFDRMEAYHKISII